MTYMIVTALGLLVGWTELMSRYRDAPFSAALTRGGLIYLGVNALAAVAALFLLDTFGGDTFQSYEAGLQRDTARAIVAGFGAVVVLRSSLFRVRVDQSDISVGPAAILDVLLRVADRDADRSRAFSRADEIPGLVVELDPKVAREELAPLCLALMQNLSQEEQRALSDQVNLINNRTDLGDVSKAINIGLLLSGFVGVQVLTRAIRSIKDRPPPAAPRAVPTDDIKRDLALDRGAAVEAGGGSN
jgi:hypothetical protein